MISTFIDVLQSTKLELTGEEIADVLWLAHQLPQSEESEVVKFSVQGYPLPPMPPATKLPPPEPPLEDEKPLKLLPESHNAPPQPTVKLYVPPPPSISSTGMIAGTSLRSPAATALPGALEIARALRPLMRRVPSRTRFVLDEEETVQRIAEEGLWIPVLRSALSKWLEVALVVDDGDSMVIWRQTAAELRLLLERHGAFRDVRTWSLVTNEKETAVSIHAWAENETAQGIERSPRELIDPSGRRLILVLSDCVSPAWRNGTMAKELAAWGRNCPVAVIQVLPQHHWCRTGIGEPNARMHALAPGVPNVLLKSELRPRWFGDELPEGIAVPVVTLDLKSLAPWAEVVAGLGGASAIGTLMPINSATDEAEAVKQANEDLEDLKESESVDLASSVNLTPSLRVKRFRSIASPTARELAGYLAAAPLSLPVMRIVQQAMMPQSYQAHLAEVFLSGLLKQITPDSVAAHRQDIQYDFYDDVRDLLLNTISMHDAVQVLSHVSDFVESRMGQGLSFRALLASPESQGDMTIPEGSLPFASVAAKVLGRIGRVGGIGGNYARAADRLTDAIINSAELYRDGKPDPSFKPPDVKPDPEVEEWPRDFPPGQEIFPYYQRASDSVDNDSNESPANMLSPQADNQSSQAFYWEILARNIAQNNCVIIVGSGINRGASEFNISLSYDLAGAYEYPFHDRWDLARVTQFLALTHKPQFPQNAVADWLIQTPPPDFNNPENPYRRLADLPLPIYLTTNYDDYLEKALISAGKSPQVEWCQWQSNFRSKYNLDKFTPSVTTPLVFHLHGHFKYPESLVLTEDDHLEFLSNLSRHRDNMIPEQVRRRLLRNAVLFVGFNLETWGMRTLLRQLSGSPDRRLNSTRVVQLKSSSILAGEQVTIAQEYAKKYCHRLALEVYDGQVSDFTSQLHRQLNLLKEGDSYE